MVLLVEDDCAIGAVLTTVFNEILGIDVALAATDGHATRLVVEQCPELLLDLGLPDASDVELGQFLREVCDQGAPVILCSAAGETARAAALQMGAAAYLAKPFELDELIATIPQLLPAIHG